MGSLGGRIKKKKKKKGKRTGSGCRRERGCCAVGKGQERAQKKKEKGEEVREPHRDPLWVAMG